MKKSKTIEDNCGCTSIDLDKVYHSETMHEMEIAADLQGVDLCNPYVLFFLARETTYHHAFWPHTRKRFTAFKNILRHNKLVKESLKDMEFYTLITTEFNDMLEYKNDLIYDTPGRKQERKNMQQVIDIVEKILANVEAL